MTSNVPFEGQRLDDFARDYAQRTQARQRKKWIGIVVALLLGVAAADFWVPRHHHTYFWDVLPAISAGYGLLSTTLIILFSRVLGRRVLRPEETPQAEPVL